METDKVVYIFGALEDNLYTFIRQCITIKNKIRLLELDESTYVL